MSDANAIPAGAIGPYRLILTGIAALAAFFSPTVPTAQVLIHMTWMVDTTGWFFRDVSAFLDVPMKIVRDVLNWLPWPVVLLSLTIAGYAAAGWRLALFTFLSIAYMTSTASPASLRKDFCLPAPIPCSPVHVPPHARA